VQQAIAYLDNAPAGFFTADGEGTIDYLNATLAQWLGLDLADVASGQLRLANIMSRRRRCTHSESGRGGTQGATRRFVIDLVKADGTTLPVRILHCLPRYGGNGGLAHALVSIRAPAARRRSRPAELRFAPAVQLCAIAIAHRRPAKASSALPMPPLCGCSAAPSMARPARKVSLASLATPTGAEALGKALDAAIAGQGLIEPVDIAFEGDKERSGRVYLSPVERAEGESEAAIAYAIDTTQQRALEMQIAQSQKMQAIGQLAGGIAHDFNQHADGDHRFSDFPADEPPPDRSCLPGHHEHQAERQPRRGSRAPTPRLLPPADLASRAAAAWDVLSELSILLGRLLGENIELKLDSGGDIWPVKADLHQFEQVIINLAVNARDAMPDGGKLVIRTANVSERDSLALGQHRVPPGEYVLIEVSDTGTGMAPEVMQKMFEPFFSTKEVGRGTGLGLSTVYGIVKQTGGYIFAESELGHGTVMHVYLPRYVDVAREAEPARAPALARREQPKDLTGRGTVLLVEDEDAVRSFAARALRPARLSRARGHHRNRGARDVHELQRRCGPRGQRRGDARDGRPDLDEASPQRAPRREDHLHLRLRRGRLPPQPVGKGRLHVPPEALRPEGTCSGGEGRAAGLSALPARANKPSAKVFLSSPIAANTLFRNHLLAAWGLEACRITKNSLPRSMKASGGEPGRSLACPGLPSTAMAAG
jgi:two-component system cell cycle sensor histidine kinase/response regulator CckA